MLFLYQCTFAAKGEKIVIISVFSLTFHCKWYIIFSLTVYQSDRLKPQEVKLESVKMSRVADFFGNLKRSTKITMLSCACLVLLTLLITVFFVLFPITPSEKIMSNIGRESIFRDNGSGGAVTAVPGVVTTISGTAATSTVATSKVSTKSTASTTRTNYKINVTTGSGFLWNGRIPTAIMPGNYETYTTPVDNGYANTTAPVESPSASAGIQEPTGWVPEPTGGWTPDPNAGYVDPNGGYVDPGVTPDPGVVTPDPGVVTPDPGVVTPDPGVVTPDPGVVTPDPGVPDYSGGGETGGGEDSPLY